MKLRDFLALYNGSTKVYVINDKAKTLFAGNVFSAKFCEYKYNKVVSSKCYKNMIIIEVECI